MTDVVNHSGRVVVVSRTISRGLCTWQGRPVQPIRSSLLISYATRNTALWRLYRWFVDSAVFCSRQLLSLWIGLEDVCSRQALITVAEMLNLLLSVMTILNQNWKLWFFCHNRRASKSLFLLSLCYDLFL